MSRHSERDRAGSEIVPTYAARDLAKAMPRGRLPAEGMAPSDAIGASTIGSSEACMLGGMAMKRRWQARQRAASRSADRPNLVLGANAQVCWHKFCRYWDVQPREVTAEGDRFTLCAERLLDDLRRALAYFESQPSHRAKDKGSHFHH